MVTFALILALLGIAADAVTTIMAMRRGHEEGNPLFPHKPAGVIALSVTMGIALFLATTAVRQFADAVFIVAPLLALAGWKGLAAWHNVTVMRGEK